MSREKLEKFLRKWLKSVFNAITKIINKKKCGISPGQLINSLFFNWEENERAPPSMAMPFNFCELFSFFHFAGTESKRQVESAYSYG